MQVGVGYSENPDSTVAGVQAAVRAVSKAGRSEPCDMVLLFSTARHDQQILREAVVSVIGDGVPIYGGGAVGIITNEYFGYAGDQVGLACLWLDGVRCDVLIDGGLMESEDETGLRLGERLAELDTKPESPVMLFYDALDISGGGIRMVMATWLLSGLKRGLGFLPDLMGAGLMGDHACSHTDQWTGAGIGEHYAMALAFSGDIRIDSVIMHGCRPATQYYTVTKAEGPVILEINNEPALEFMDRLLGPAIAPADYPFFLIFGVNHGERWGEYDENYYASRLCLGIDQERSGIVMFEPDMIEGTEFQLMYRSLDLDYMRPKIDKVFEELGGREPIFAMYIDCAGRCAGYAGMDAEDAPVIQEMVAGRVPVLGLYTGVEIASIGGSPRGLDWTGVFCLFSQSNGNGGETVKKNTSQNAWDVVPAGNESEEASAIALARIAEQNAAKILEIDSGSVVIRHELEQKRRGFSLLAELAVSLRQQASYESLFVPVAQRINALLNMQRTVVLTPDGGGLFSPTILQGYPNELKALLASKHVELPSEMTDGDKPVLVTAADPLGRLKDFRELFDLPYLISTPVILRGEVAAVLVTGRMVEAHPYLLRLGRNDVETVQAISTLLASALASQRLAAAEERNRIMLDSMPMCCVFWDEYGEQTDCNQEALSFFGVPGKEEFLQNFYGLSPEYQPDGRLSEKTIRENILKAFVSGNIRFEWTFQTLGGELIPSEVALLRVPRGEDYIVAGYIRDLREQRTTAAKMREAYDLADRSMRAKSEFMASISHEIRTPMNSILAMARMISELKLDEKQRQMIDQGVRSTQLLISAIESILDFSKMDSGSLTLEVGGFSVRELVEGLCGVLRPEAEGKMLALKTRFDSGIPAMVVGDPVRLEQLLFNIAANAIKFTERGGVEIRVFANDADRSEGVLLTFEVCDTGIGIAEERMNDIFKPLTAGDAAFDRKYAGLGMGLAISQGLAILMGGEITCESRLGEGSTFRLTLPFSLPDDVVSEGEDSPGSEILEDLRGMRVLLAEDNVINQMIAEELLTVVGIDLTIADNGVKALEELERGSFDVVLMDIQMPEMDGLTATARIRADDRYDGLPVLALTANTATEHIAESMRVGMNGHLSKPIDVDQLYGALRRCVRSKV